MQTKWNRNASPRPAKTAAADVVEAFVSKKVIDLPKDPVCRFEVSPSHTPWAYNGSNAKYTSTRRGQTYYFCSASCKGQFDKNPMKYTKST